MQNPPSTTHKNKVAIIVAVAIGLAMAAGAIWLFSSRDNRDANSNGGNGQPLEMEGDFETIEVDDEANEPADGAAQGKPQPTAETSAGNATAGTYTTYSDAALASAGDRQRVLFFHAPWCPQCRDLEADIENSGVPNGMAILKVDYDSNQALRQRYGVTQQTTVVSIDKDGNKQKSFLPYSDPRLANALDGLDLQ